MNARAEMPEPDFELIIGMLASPHMHGRSRFDEQGERLRSWLAAQPLAPEGGGGMPEPVGMDEYERLRTAPPAPAREATESVTLDEWRAGSAVTTVRMTLGGKPPPWRTDRDALLALVTAFDHATLSEVKEYIALREAPAPAREAVGRVEGYMGLSDGQGHKVYLVGYTDGTLPLGTPLYAHPAAGAVVVDEAMVERACAAYQASNKNGLSDRLRAALTAAIGGAG